jgi:hypothetical protein
MVDNNTAAALLYGTVPTMSDTNTASHAWSVEEAAAAQQVLNHSAHAPYPAPMMYNVGPYWQGTRAVPRTFSHKRPKGSRVAATLNTFASTPDPAAVPGGARPRQDAAALTGHIVLTEGPARLYSAASHNEVPSTYCPIDATAHTEKQKSCFPMHNGQMHHCVLHPALYQ